MAKKDGGSGLIANQERADEVARQQRIQAGTDNINSMFDGQFNDDFFNKQRQNYIDYASPQLEDQYGQAQKQLVYSLARNGNLDSSARADLEGQLQKKYDLNKQQIADQGVAYGNQSRNSVEDARSQLIGMLNSTGDASGAVNSAISRAQSLSQPPSYSTLSNLFTDFTSALGTQAALERADAYSGGMVKPAINTGLFAPSAGAVQVR